MSARGFSFYNILASKKGAATLVVVGMLVVAFVLSPLFSQPFLFSQASPLINITRSFTLIAEEKELQVAPDNPIHPGGIMYKAMVFNGTIPGPVLSVNQGDIVQMTLINNGTVIHSLDFHAALGPDANSGPIQAGYSKTWAFRADNAGAFFYHCGADGLNGVWEHIASGMYGGIVVHPANEKPAKEFYVAFGEIYNSADKGPFVGSNGTVGTFDLGKLWADNSDLELTNGMAHKYVPSIGVATKIPLNANAEIFKVKPGEQTRWYIVNAGPNDYVAFHFIAGMIDVRDGSIINRYGTQVKNDETWTIPPGSASVIETVFPEEGIYVGVDHNMSHVLKGGAFVVLATNDSTEGDQPEGTDPPRPLFSTQIILNPLPSVVENKGLTVGGVLVDGTGHGLSEQKISFESNGASTAIFPEATTRGVKFISDDEDGITIKECQSLVLGQCTNDSPSTGTDRHPDNNKVLHLKVNGRIVMPENTDQVKLWFLNLDSISPIYFNMTVTDNLSRSRTFSYVTSSSSEMSNTETIFAPEGIKELKIQSVSGNPHGSYVDIAALVTYNTKGVPQAQHRINFEEYFNGQQDSPFEVDKGYFFSTANTNSVMPGKIMPAQEVIAKYDGYDPTGGHNSHMPLGGSAGGTTILAVAFAQGAGIYREPASASALYDVLPDPTKSSSAPSGLGGAGANQITPTADTVVAVSVTGMDCGGTLYDSDQDSLCNSWENGSGIRLPGSTTTKHYDLKTSDPKGSLANPNFDDLYVEYDYMPGYALKDSDEADLKAAFNSMNINLHLVRDEQIPVWDPLNVWSDLSSSRLSGTYTATPIATPDVAEKFQVTGLAIVTSGPIPAPGQTLQLNSTLKFSANPGTNVRVTAINIQGYGDVFNPVSGAGFTDYTSPTSSSSFSNIIVSNNDCTSQLDVCKTRGVSATLTFTTRDAATSANGGLGTITFTIEVGDSTTNIVSITPGLKGQIITNNDDFDGIKANYFGTAEERRIANGTLGMGMSYLQEKLQAYRYAIAAKSIGLDATTCGPSGTAEWVADGPLTFRGNDFVVALGGKNANGQNCFPTNPAEPIDTPPNGSIDEREGTWMHEIGHSLGLRHGGGDDDNCKVNYPSIMSYTRQFKLAGIGDSWSLTYSSGKYGDVLEKGVSEAIGIDLAGQSPYMAVWSSRNGQTVTGMTVPPMNWDNSTQSSGYNVLAPTTVRASGTTIQSLDITGLRIQTTGSGPWRESGGVQPSVYVKVPLTFVSSGSALTVTGVPTVSVAGSPPTNFHWDTDVGENNVWVNKTSTNSLVIIIAIPFTADAAGTYQFGTIHVGYNLQYSRTANQPPVSSVIKYPAWSIDLNDVPATGCDVSSVDKVRLRGFNDITALNFNARGTLSFDGASFGVITSSGDPEGEIGTKPVDRYIGINANPGLLPEINSKVLQELRDAS